MRVASHLANKTGRQVDLEKNHIYGFYGISAYEKMLNNMPGTVQVGAISKAQK